MYDDVCVLFLRSTSRHVRVSDSYSFGSAGTGTTEEF